VRRAHVGLALFSHFSVRMSFILGVRCLWCPAGFGGFGSIDGKFEIISKIPHEGEVNRCVSVCD
jgi:hypothetical protein